MTPERLLAAWERGTLLAPTDRAASLLAVVDPACRVDDLSVGQCDALLLRLRTQLFGDSLDATATCPGCGEQVDLRLSMSALMPRFATSLEPASEVTTEGGGFRAVLRTVRNSDLRALAGLGSAVQARDVVARCVLEASGPDGEELPVDELPDAFVAAALEELGDADPAAEILLSIECPCGTQWTDQLDIRTVLWAEVERWSTDLMHDVHHLAGAYGWSESDIVRLSPWRRDWYRQAVGW